MYEFSIARKYLFPRWRQLSVSIISLISVFVISLVVWLIVVFFSVTHGLEHIWINKLIALTAPVRVTPTEAYYQSYYHQIDNYSAASDYRIKSFEEKLHAPLTDPYDPLIDEELPAHFPPPLFHSDGTPKDLVKELYASFQRVQGIKGLTAEEFDTAYSTLQLQLKGKEEESWLNQPVFVGTFSGQNPLIEQALLNYEGETREIERETPSGSFSLPHDMGKGEGVVLPKTFREAGVRTGDRGALLYYSPSATTLQEQHLPIFVAGFYDPGIIPIGGKYVLATKETAGLIHAAQHAEDRQLASGINLRMDRLEDVDRLKQQLLNELTNRGILPYFTVETYREYEFTKDLIQQLNSEKNLYTLLATVIIVVACSNIVSMLIILVNDKKHEIGILRSMGATSLSIASIFGTCGIVMGAMGSFIGTGLAVLTLSHLEGLIEWIGYFQGYEMFNAAFYGETIPNELSLHALTFVFAATSVISLIAGLIPAIKACRLKPAAILRAE